MSNGGLPAQYNNTSVCDRWDSGAGEAAAQ